MQATQVWSLGLEDPLEEEMATHSSILAWRIPWTEEPGGLPSTGSWRVGHNWVTVTTNTSCSELSWEMGQGMERMRGTLEGFDSNVDLRVSGLQRDALKSTVLIWGLEFALDPFELFSWFGLQVQTSSLIVRITAGSVLRLPVFSDCHRLVALVGFPGATAAKNPPASAGDTRDSGAVPGSGRPHEGNGRSLQYLPGKSHGQRRLAGYGPWRHKESDTAEQLSTHVFH